jgi:hypothetical protein
MDSNVNKVCMFGIKLLLQIKRLIVIKEYFTLWRKGQNQDKHVHKRTQSYGAFHRRRVTLQIMISFSQK